MKKHIYIVGIILLTLWIPLCAQNCFERAKLDKKRRTFRGMDGVQYFSAMGSVNFDATFSSLGYFIESTSWHPLTQEIGGGITFFHNADYLGLLKGAFLSTSSKFYLTDFKRKSNAYGNKGAYLGIWGSVNYCPYSNSTKLVYIITPEFGCRFIFLKRAFIEFMTGVGYSNVKLLSYPSSDFDASAYLINVNLRIGLLTTK